MDGVKVHKQNLACHQPCRQVDTVAQHLIVTTCKTVSFPAGVAASEMTNTKTHDAGAVLKPAVSKCTAAVGKAALIT